MNLLRLPLILATQAYDLASVVFNRGPAPFYKRESRLHGLAVLATGAAGALLHLLNCNDAADDLWERTTTSAMPPSASRKLKRKKRFRSRRRPCASTKKPAPRIRPRTRQTQGRGTVPVSIDEHINQDPFDTKVAEQMWAYTFRDLPAAIVPDYDDQAEFDADITYLRSLGAAMLEHAGNRPASSEATIYAHLMSEMSPAARRAVLGAWKTFEQIWDAA
jgi:hypothetical protein